MQPAHASAMLAGSISGAFPVLPFRAMELPAAAVSLGRAEQACGYPAGTGLANLNAPVSKSSALLGLPISRLELIAQQQQTSSIGQPVAQVVLSPALAPDFRPNPAPCASLAIKPAWPSTTGTESRLPGSDDFLASKRLPIRHTAFDASWRRVRDAGLGAKRMKGLFPSIANAGETALLSAVNAWTNAHVRYVEDQQLYGRGDYWASAGATLRSRAGDCEDIAILKMQLLAAQGVARSDMYLTIARDLVRNADHALLIVKADDRYWMLDNATDKLIDASQRADYRPILSYSANGTWLHGYEAPAIVQSTPRQTPVALASADS